MSSEVELSSSASIVSDLNEKTWTVSDSAAETASAHASRARDTVVVSLETVTSIFT